MARGMMIAKDNPNITNWSFENGYDHGIIGKDYPLRVSGSGRDAALEISLDIFEKDFELLCTKKQQGFRVILKVPGDESMINENPIIVPLLEETVITLRPKLTETSTGLRIYDPNHRKCFFDSERKLRFYKIYTQKNCYAECLANFTKIQCKCAKFSQPSKYKLQFNSIQLKSNLMI